MDMNKLSGRVFGQQTLGEKDEQGYWKITVVMTEKIIFPDGTSKEEKIESMCMDKDFDTAHQIALHSALSELRELVYDKNFDSLIEGREYQRVLETDDGSSNKANPDTTA